VWNDKGFQLNGTQFQIIVGLHDMFSLKDEDGLVLCKPKEMIERYLDLLEGMDARYIFELGIFRGGSTAFFNEFLKPEKLIAIDFMDKPRRGFRNYLDTGIHANRIRACFGVNQADTSKLEEIYSKEIGSEPLDLVVDDASHMLEETRASFNVLFPKLKPGAWYIIEDWGWAHVPDPAGAFEKNVGNKAPLSNLIIEIMLASTRRPLLFPEIRVFPTSIFVRRGDANIEDDFDIAQQSFYWNQSIGGTNLFDRHRLELMPSTGTND
ncbi:MAG: class I SAM-dependent methyltransferase, partial [Parvibaculum sp.]